MLNLFSFCMISINRELQPDEHMAHRHSMQAQRPEYKIESRMQAYHAKAVLGVVAVTVTVSYHRSLDREMDAHSRRSLKCHNTF